ncbi:MAG: hypothetical protein AAGE94_16590 [Acidobacteriota bacterium]
MKRSSHPLVLCLALTVALLAVPASAQPCVQYQGIDHCPVGNASLQLSSDGLAVQNLGGSSGVSSRFSPTIHWNAEMQFAPGTPHNTVLSSISGGETTSRLLIEPDGGGFHARATFTGASEQPTYSILVYNNGVLQGAVGGVDAGAATKARQRLGRAVPTKPGQASDAEDDVRMVLYIDGIRMGYIDVDIIFHFFISPMGGCNWGMSMAQAVAIQMPDGNQVLGDEIRFAEDVDGPGHYPYLGFESIDTVTTASSLLIRNELAEGTN